MSLNRPRSRCSRCRRKSLRHAPSRCAVCGGENVALRRERKKAKRRAVRPQDKVSRNDPHYGRLLYHYRRCIVGNINGAYLDELLEKQDWKCAYCRCVLYPDNQVLEHMTPLSRGGTNDRSNVCWACWDCNTRKGTQTYDEFMKRSAGGTDAPAVRTTESMLGGDRARHAS